MKCDKCGAPLYPGSCRMAPNGIPLFVCDVCYNKLKQETTNRTDSTKSK